MLGIHDYWAFVLTGVLLNLTPGQDTLFILGRSAADGMRAGIASALGITLGAIIHTLVAALGLSAILATSATAFAVVKWVGAAYLAWLGLRLLRSKGGLDLSQLEERRGPMSTRRIFARSFLVAVTNPKGYLFCSALLPQFIDASAPQWPQYAAIAGVFAGLDFLVMLGYAVVGARAVRLLRQRAVLWLDRSCGAALLALAGSLAFYRRATP